MNNNEFIKELKKININLNEEQIKKFEKYNSFLLDYNKKVNLTAIKIPNDIYLKHFYDSACIIKIINFLEKNLEICDFGTGAGFPGVVLKIINPNIKLTLVESVTKKTVFLKKLVDELRLSDVTIVNVRMEDFSKKNQEKFDIVVSRAVANLTILLELSSKATKIGGYIVAMKSHVEKEKTNTEGQLSNLKLQEIEQIEYFLPFENSLRTLIKYQKTEKTPAMYPRNYSQIKKD